MGRKGVWTPAQSKQFLTFHAEHRMMHLTREPGEDGPEGFDQKLGFSSRVR
jgi:hypothetical protein